MAMAYLAHYGVKRRSGRYPWGSGEVPYQHESWFYNGLLRYSGGGMKPYADETSFLNEVRDLHKQGLTEKEISEHFGLTLRELRAQKSNALVIERQTLRNQAISMYDRGMNYSEIARSLNLNESRVRNLVKSTATKKEEALLATTNLLKDAVDKNDYVDVGDGVATSIGISETRFDAALQNLKNQGYEVTNIWVKQAGDSDKSTTVRVLAKPGATRKEILENRDKIALINEKFVDQDGKNMYGLEPIKSISSKKVMINYAEDGGKDRDGLIELRRGAEGLDLGNSLYAQVRIGVDGTHYIKGMAVYADDLPPGIDIRFNTNKHKGTPKMQCLKEFKDDPDNPFGTEIKKGGQRGYLNMVYEESDWGKWSKTLASQMLSKQSQQLARQQLGLKYAEFEQEYKDIMSYNNPTVKQYLLNQFADKCDTAAVDLKAAAMPRQASYVILPVPSLKDNEVYAPKYKDGEKVVLIRYPHAGIFEIPELVVNNKNKEGRRILGNAADDAIGINAKTAQQLSGADFDGDTVIVIPNNKGSIKTRAAIPELLNFDTKEQYARTPATRIINGKKWDDPHAKTISEDHKQKEMGVVSNLITDMTLKGAPLDHIIRAVKYSMVVIDSEKHGLDYRQAAIDNNINELKRIYQPHENDNGAGGASTLISRAKSEARIPKSRLSPKPDPVTGRREYEPVTSNNTYIDSKTGKVVERVSTVPKMRLTTDARTLSSGKPMENIYADFANSLKALANKSRLDAMEVTPVKYSPAAKKEYAEQVNSLTTKIGMAEAHAPVERKAQLIASVELQMKMQENPELREKGHKKERQKIINQALTRARETLGGPRPTVNVTEKEWEAIQKGAVSKTTLKTLLKYADPEQIKKYALPKEQHGLTSGQISLIRARLAAGYTQAQVAEILGISASTVSRALHG